MIEPGEQPLRVCMIVTYDLASHGGGVKQHALHLAAALRERGDDVVLVGPSSGALPSVDPALKTFGGVVNVPSNGSDNQIGLFVSPRQVARFFRENAFDVIHVHEPLNPALAYWSVWWTRHVPHVATFHAYAEAEGTLRRYARGVGGAVIFPWFQRGIAVSKAAAHYATRAWSRELAIIPNGVPGDVFTPSGTPSRTPSACVRLLFVGRLGDRRKGAAVLYEAYRGLLARGLSVSLDVVGELGSAEPPPALPGLHYHGALEMEALAELYRACDVFVAPSTGQESFGIVLLEAMASAKPIVCSDIEGYRQVVVPEGAVLVPPSDPVALEAALAEVVALPPAARAEQGTVNRRVAEGYAWSRIATEVRAEYVAAIADARAERRAEPAGGRPPGLVWWSRHAGLLLALCLVLRLVSLLRPCLSDDEATYAVVGREMLAGHALYRDTVDHKPPAIYVVNEITQAIAGPIGGMVLLHALLILVVWATGMLLAGIVRRFDRSIDSRGPPLVALLWIVFTTTLVDADSLAANCELFMMLPLVASAYVFLSASGRLAYLVAAGALVGLAMLFKYQAGVQLPLFGLTWLIARRATPGRAVAGLLALGVGVAIPIGGAIAAMWTAGTLDAAVFWFKFNFAYIDAGNSGGGAGQVLLRAGFVVVAALPLYVMAALAVFRTEPQGRAFRGFALAWLIANGCAVIVGGRFFGHYFHQVTAPLAVLAAPVAVRAWTHARGRFIAVLAVPAAIFFALGVFHDALMRAAGEPDPDYSSVVAWLDEHGTPTDAICVWGNSPVLYFEANRPLGCRFVFSNYTTGMSPATRTQSDPTVDSSANIVPEAWDMLESDLLTRKPRFVIDASPGNIASYGKYPPAKFPRLARILACRYEVAAELAGMRIYSLAASPRCEVHTPPLARTSETVRQPM